MNQLGIHTGADLKERTLSFLQQHFGKSGAYYFGISRGIDERPGRADRVRKSVGAENTFFEDLHTLEPPCERLCSQSSIKYGGIAKQSVHASNSYPKGEIRRLRADYAQPLVRRAHRATLRAGMRCTRPVDTNYAGQKRRSIARRVPFIAVERKIV